MSALLEAEGLVKRFTLREPGLFGRHIGTVHAVENVDLTIEPGETLALVGESGCGKTTLARTLAHLHLPDAGEVRFEGRKIPDPPPLAFRRKVQLVFQDPWSSLNPRLTAGAIIAEPLRIHGLPDRAARVEAMAGAVGLDPGALTRHPHQFSGGQRQRIAIARALVAEPSLLIADEPVSALDVSIQSQILNLLSDLRERLGLAVLFVGHDLSVVRHFADRVAVMYLGRIVECRPTSDLFTSPRHPYTRALLDAVPKVGRGKRTPGHLPPGDVPSPLAPPPGCAYHPRCPKAMAECRLQTPRPVPLEGMGHAACLPTDDQALSAMASRRHIRDSKNRPSDS